jgi:hypothetical protein
VAVQAAVLLAGIQERLVAEPVHQGKAMLVVQAAFLTTVAVAVALEPLAEIALMTIQV